MVAKRRSSLGRALVAAALIVLAGGCASGSGVGPRWFPDRPVAWQEHDQAHVADPPAASRLQNWDVALLLRDSLANEVDRVLALEGDQAAQDVNALDEVPCSTWFCPRNHLTPMTAAAIAEGPPVRPPRLPLRIVHGKHQGATAGFQVVDADDRRFLLKLDPGGRPGLASGPEVIGQRLFHAAGYNVPGAFVIDLDPGRDLTVDPAARFELYGVQERPLTEGHVATMLARAARTDQHLLRAAAVPWIPGRVLGGFDMLGTRPGDPNDRIPHQHRRSLRASWVLFAWLSSLDPSSINTLDSYVEEGGRRFVRHYIIDFGAALGGATVHPKDLHQGAEHLIEVGRSLAALASLGFFRRPFQDDKAVWRQLTSRYPRLGWFPAWFDPDQFRSNRKVPTHVRRTPADLYWGAKLVTAFSDDQLAAAVSTARLDGDQARYLVLALAARRDIIGRRYLAALTAVERPQATPAGDRVCFQDLAVERGYLSLTGLRYAVEITDGRRGLLAALEQPAAGAQTCLPLPRGPVGTGYRIVRVSARPGDGRAALPATQIHLRWRAAEGRFVVVGMERAG